MAQVSLPSVVRYVEVSQVGIAPPPCNRVNDILSVRTLSYIALWILQETGLLNNRLEGRGSASSQDFLTSVTFARRSKKRDLSHNMNQFRLFFI